MPIIIEHYRSAAWVNISDYVVRCEKVPFISRNRDWTIRTETVNIEIAVTIRDFYNDANFEFVIDDKFRIKTDAKVLYAGLADKMPFDYRSQTWTVQTRDNLDLLDRTILCYDNIHAEISGGTPVWYEYLADSTTSAFQEVGVLYLMKKMFAKVGLTLDTSALDAEIVFTHDFGEFPNNGVVAVLWRELYLDEAEMYCINQDVAVVHTHVDDTAYELIKNRPTFWDVINEICSALTLAVIIVASESYKLITKTANYTVADNDKFEYSDDTIRSEQEIGGVGLALYGAVRNLFYGAAPGTNLTFTGQRGEGLGITALKNLRILFSDRERGADVDGATLELEVEATPTDTTGIKNAIKNKVIAKISDYTKEEIQSTTVTNDYTVLKNEIDIEWDNSEIVQEVYE